MEKQVVLKDVPEEDLEKVIDDFMSDGAIKTRRELQPDGKWTVVAIIEDKSE